VIDHAETYVVFAHHALKRLLDRKTKKIRLRHVANTEEAVA
jgi:hypothetical protein